jgi:hypothetical protein
VNVQRAVGTIAARLLAVAAGAGLACGSLGWIDGREWAALTGADAAALVAPAKPLTTRIHRVRFDLTPGGAAVTHEIVFPKGALTSLLPPGAAGSLEGTLFVAFTAQARPLAFEATRIPLDGDGRPIDAAAQPLKVDHVVVRPATAPALLGNPHAAGHVLHLPRGADAFVLRLRSAIAVEPGHKTVTLLARLGMRDAGYLPLGRVEVTATLGTRLRGARATLCGLAADPTPISLSFPDYPAAMDAGVDANATVRDPSLITRHLDDDLCVEAQID